MHVIYINFIEEKVLLETISLDNLYKFRYIHDKINLILTLSTNGASIHFAAACFTEDPMPT